MSVGIGDIVYRMPIKWPCLVVDIDGSTVTVAEVISDDPGRRVYEHVEPIDSVTLVQKAGAWRLDQS